MRPVVPIHQHPNRFPLSHNPQNGSMGQSPSPGARFSRGGPHQPDNYQMVYIQEDALTLKNELGQGEFGSVLKGTYRTPEGAVVITYIHVHVNFNVHCTCT